uniref:Reticulon-like protein n=2 Tax=Physcomitrium patens TaxID=3218 RepID=A0A2K1JPG2_PHYPA|nr:reticulon-like protein B10 [Physcomitrium patens]XP_024390440.1 reticulon-like protein B10 [Physcomitrium patens]XP_024390441.1 reticulon-like protein B10 [Physcomitrium patens]XP_024390442.1 reticulon-like protein B10 [Physcomitrium patens]XP_024390443.1 reticulon-like protein B10 [Physcomitrium patens]PNR43434.1 hypothetical protein PHYPA_015815 [Physcomitrium patens]|eukprot:XP_024390439.1 reticulon-like protein B10 [Physcomitrella patens]
MSEQSDVSHSSESVMDSVIDQVGKMPASQPAPSSGYGPGNRFLTKDKNVHQILGGGRAADAFLWKDRNLSAIILGGSTLVWFLLEKSGYTFLTLLSNILMFSVIILFVWANVAALLNRAGPPVPELSLSEDFVLRTASTVRVELNKALSIARDVALGKDFKLFLKMVVLLWVVSTVTSWFNFLTCIWIGVVLLHVVPFVYDKYEDIIDLHAAKAVDAANIHYKKLDDAVLRKIPRAPAKEKKVL